MKGYYIKTYTSNKSNADKIQRELERRNEIFKERKINPKFKGRIYKTTVPLAAIALLLGVVSPIIPDKTVDGKEGNSISSMDESQSNTNTVSNKVEESNVSETLLPGDVIEFERAYVAHYKHSDEYGGSWVVSSEQNATNNVEWCFAMHREVGNYGYVDMSAVEEYRPYLAKNASLVYKSDFDQPFNRRIDCEQGSVLYINDRDAIIDTAGNTLYKVLIQNKISEDGIYPKYDYFVGYTDKTQIERSNKEFSLGLVTKKTFVRSSPELIGNKNLIENVNENTGIKYIVDISTYRSDLFPDYLETLQELQDKGLLGGVIMEIARCETGYGLHIGCIRGNYELDSKFSKIEKKVENSTLGSMGEYDEFKKYVDETSKICPVGYYVYTDVLTPDETSALANVVSETEKQLKQDIEDYDKITKIPLVIDIEKGSDSEKEERTEQAIQFVKLLGHGTNKKDYWTLKDGKEGAKEGLGVIDNQYMLYTLPSIVSATKDREKSGHQLTCVEDIANATSDYTLINFGALYVDGILGKSTNSKEYQNLLDPETLVQKMYSDGNYSNPSIFSFHNVAQADIMQCMGNVNIECIEKLKLKRQLIDISVCPTSTYEAILNGEFKGHKGTFLGNMTRAVEQGRELKDYQKASVDIIGPTIQVADYTDREEQERGN